MIVCGGGGYIESLLLEETFKVIVLGGGGGGIDVGCGGIIYKAVVPRDVLDKPYVFRPTGDIP